MRIALFFVAFTLGAGLALGLEAADASARHREQQERQSITVEVPATPENSGGAVEVLPVRWDGELSAPADRHVRASTSPWSPGAGELALVVVAAGTVGAGLLVRRRVLVPVRA